MATLGGINVRYFCYAKSKWVNGTNNMYTHASPLEHSMDALLRLWNLCVW